MGMVFITDIYLLLAAHKRILALCWPFNQSIFCLFHCVHCVYVLSGWWILINKYLQIARIGAIKCQTPNVLLRRTASCCAYNYTVSVMACRRWRIWWHNSCWWRSCLRQDTTVCLSLLVADIVKCSAAVWPACFSAKSNYRRTTEQALLQKRFWCTDCSIVGIVHVSCVFVNIVLSSRCVLSTGLTINIRRTCVLSRWTVCLERSSCLSQEQCTVSV